MLPRIRTWNGLCLLAVGALASTAALAAQAPNKPRPTASQESYFRCKDRHGQTQYGDSVPVQCNGLDVEVLNERGTVLRVIEGDQSRAAREAREAEELKQVKLREERQQHDHMLLDTYLSVEDIERLRDSRIEMLSSQYSVTEQNITDLRDRQGRLQGQISRFRPYSDSATAPPLPDHLAEEMVNTVNDLRTYQESLTKNKSEQEEIKTSFAADIRRFKELKGIK